jgi:hypothetical protein
MNKMRVAAHSRDFLIALKAARLKHEGEEF